VLTVGFVSGISLIIGEVALVSLAFSGQLAPYLSQGIGLILFGTAAACVVTGLRSGFAGAAAGPTMATMIALGVIGGSLTATGDELLPTMVAIIVLGSVATAACALLIERFRLANLVRFFPYPVSSGFVAGTGGLACVVALRLMGVRLDAEALASLFDPLVVTNWGVGVAYGLGLYFASRRWPSPLLMPGASSPARASCTSAWRVSVSRPRRRRTGASCSRVSRDRTCGRPWHSTMRRASTGARSALRFRTSSS